MKNNRMFSGVVAALVGLLIAGKNAHSAPVSTDGKGYCPGAVIYDGSNAACVDACPRDMVTLYWGINAKKTCLARVQPTDRRVKQGFALLAYIPKDRAGYQSVAQCPKGLTPKYESHVGPYRFDNYLCVKVQPFNYGGGRGGRTGSVKMDKAVYAVPGRASATTGDVIVHVRVNDPDFSRARQIAVGAVGPVAIKVIGGDRRARTIFTAGGQAASGRELGPIKEIDPGSGIFQADVRLTADMDIRAGDRLSAEYLDPKAASGAPNLATDQSEFAMRTANLQNDYKSVYVTGEDAIITLVDPDLNRDSQEAEYVDFNQIRWVSNGVQTTLANPAFHPAPIGGMMETGADTGIFEAVIRIPRQIDGAPILPGQIVRLQYTDATPADSSVPLGRSRDTGLLLTISDVGVNIQLDQKSYGAGDIVYVTVSAPDYDYNPDAYDTIGDGRFNDGILTVTAGDQKLAAYTLAESGSDTGVFVGKIQLSPTMNTGGKGPNLGVLRVASGQTLKFTFDNGRSIATRSAVIR